MTPFFHEPCDLDRLLVVDDTADDVTEILSVACESFRSRRWPTDAADGDSA